MSQLDKIKAAAERLAAAKEARAAAKEARRAAHEIDAGLTLNNANQRHSTAMEALAADPTEENLAALYQATDALLAARKEFANNEAHSVATVNALGRAESEVRQAYSAWCRTLKDEGLLP